VSALTDSTTGTANVAYAVGRRAGNAVRRNHIKRRLRHAVRHQAGRLSPGWYLVGVSAGIAELSFDELEVTLGRLLGEVQQ
jgi:ribonuclease P protein component